jgi:hypothetical protein
VGGGIPVFGRVEIEGSTVGEPGGFIQGEIKFKKG